MPVSAVCPVADPSRVGATICQMTHEEFAQLLEDAAKRGAKSALASVGLSDECAATDITAVRDLLKGYRLFKKEAWRVTFATAGRIFGWAIVLGLASIFFHSPDSSMKRIVHEIIKP